MSKTCMGLTILLNKRVRIRVGTDSSRPCPSSTKNGGIKNGSINPNIPIGNEDAMNRSLQSASPYEIVKHDYHTL